MSLNNERHKTLNQEPRQLSDKVQMLTQLLILSGIMVALQFAVMIKVLSEHPISAGQQEPVGAPAGSYQGNANESAI